MLKEAERKTKPKLEKFVGIWQIEKKKKKVLKKSFPGIVGEKMKAAFCGYHPAMQLYGLRFATIVKQPKRFFGKLIPQVYFKFFIVIIFCFSVGESDGGGS